MGRELRRVPKDWEHPRDDRGRFIPMHDGDNETACAEWLEKCKSWDPSPDMLEIGCRYYWHYSNPPPAYGDRGCHMFEGPRDDLTHYMLYESTSEGTPLSPAFETIEEVASWAADHATIFADFKAPKEKWLEMLSPGGLVHAQEGNVVFL